MTAAILKILLSLALELIIKHYNSLTPEQKAEFEKAIRESNDPMGGSMEGP